MNKSWRMIRFTRGMALTAAVFMAVGATSTVAQDVGGQRAGGWGAVEPALGRRGAIQPGDVMRFSFPRRDLRVTARGVRIRPAFALGSWVAFKDAGGGHAMVMGDLVITE